MKPAAQIQAVIELITEDDKSYTPADSLLNAYFRSRRYIGSKDRRNISYMFWELTRNKIKLRTVIGSSYTPRQLVIGYLKAIRGYDNADIEYLFNGEEYSPKEMILEEKIILSKDFDVELEPWQELECPEWLFEKFGANVKELEYMKKPAPLDIRVNRFKATVDDILDELEDEEIKAVPTKYSPYGIRISKRVNLDQLDCYKKGEIEVQDEGSQLVSMLCLTEEEIEKIAELRVLDYCAGAGGKTLAISSMMSNRGEIVASDINPKRLERLVPRMKRAGVRNVKLAKQDEIGDKQFDIVLVDAPCSGTGVWRRNPDSKFKLRDTELNRIKIEQAEILQKASLYVKPGGRLVYVTCSLLPEENEQQINKFIKSSKRFDLMPIDLYLVGGIKEERPDAHLYYYNLSPSLCGTDGFFGCVLKKRGSERERDKLLLQQMLKNKEKEAEIKLQRLKEERERDSGRSR